MATKQESIKSIHSEVVKLDPSAIVTLFEIDLSNLVPGKETFRFHNSFKIKNTSILFGGKEYIALPIQAEGFETSSKGVAATPKLSLSSSTSGLISSRFIEFVALVRGFGDLVGGKVTRIKTFVKYLDKKNFYDDSDKLISENFPAPEGFEPDSNAFFPPDIYFIDRKSTETKDLLEFELGSLFDLQDIKLPGRMVLRKNCIWQYRGEGCRYESVAGSVNKSLEYAPPVADEEDQKFVGLTSNKGLWKATITYSPGEYVFRPAKGVNYYFVCIATNINVLPPNSSYWTQDKCSKSLAGCRLRWGAKSPAQDPRNPLNPQKENLPFGGFPGISRE